MPQARQLRSTMTESGTLELSLDHVDVPEPAADQVLVRMEAAPINPSDMGPLFGPADLSAAKTTGDADNPVLTAPIPENRIGMVKSRWDQPMPVGNEGAGTVVAAGSDPAAQALMGRTVAVLSGSAYSQFNCVPVASVLPLPEDAEPRDGASCFVNPLTALCFLETMRAEGHTALVHGAAASNLGQMLVKLCKADGVPLVNIVRKQEQVDLLKGLGAEYVCNSSDDDFLDQLTNALAETGATLAFDPIGGGRLTNDILTCMERAASRGAKGLNTYGSQQHKQVYIYGGLSLEPTTLNRNYGMAWGVGGWLLIPALARAGNERAAELRARVASEIKTTFASKYTQELSLKEAMQPDTVRQYVAKTTGEKYLINPSKDL